MRRSTAIVVFGFLASVTSFETLAQTDQFKRAIHDQLVDCWSIPAGKVEIKNGP